MTARFQTTGALVTSTVQAGGALAFSIPALWNFFNATQILLVGSAGNGPTRAELYDTAASATAAATANSDIASYNSHRLWATDPIAGTLYAVMDWRNGQSPVQGNHGFVAPYVDADFGNNLHGVVYNRDIVAKTYSITVFYDQVLVNVKSFGAVGDGTTDDTAAIQAAITSLTTSGEVYIPPGTYKLTATLTAALFGSRRVRLHGLSRDNSILYWPNAGQNGIEPVSHTRIENLCVRGPGSGSVSPGTNGITAGAMDNVVIQDCIIEDWPDHNVNSGGSSTNWIVRHNIIRNAYNDGFLSPALDIGHLIEGNHIYGNGSNGIDLNSSRNRVIGNYVHENGAKYVVSQLDDSGIWIDPIGGNANDNLIVNNIIYLNSGDGIRHRAGETGSRTADRNSLLNNVVRQNGRIGIYIDSSGGPGSNRNINILGNLISLNGSHGLLVGGGSSSTINRVKVADNIAADNAGTGIYVIYGSGNLVSDNIATGNGTDLNVATALVSISGDGVPSLACENGSIYRRRDGGAGTTLYVREAGAWVAK